MTEPYGIGTIEDTVWKFDGDMWQKDLPLVKPRCLFTSTVINNEIVHLGGYKGFYGSGYFR